MDTRSSVPRINPWVQLVAFFGTCAAGYFIGLWLASWGAPGSGLAAGISGILLPTAFAAGLVLWSGLEIARVVVDRVRGRPRVAGSPLATGTGRWFVPLSVLLMCAGGAFVGLLPGGRGVVASLGAYGAVGALYGLVVAGLAARGYVPGPHLE